jgi:hypothetical protein
MVKQPLFNAEQVFGESLFARVLLPFMGAAWNHAGDAVVLTTAAAGRV